MSENRKIMLKKLFSLFIFFIVLFSSFDISAESSDSLFARLAGDGFNPQVQVLDNSSGTDFPYNIVLPNNGKNRKKLTFLIVQEEADFAYDLLPVLSELGEVVFTANDNSVLKHVYSADSDSFEPVSEGLAGSKTYFNYLEEPESTAVIILSEEKDIPGKNLMITAGGKKTVTPFFIMKAVFSSFEESGFKCIIRNTHLILYRLGILKNISEKADFFINNGLTASVELSFSANADRQKLTHAFNRLTELYYVIPEENDINYSVIDVGRKSIFIAEYVHVIILILITAATLFLLCGLSFLIGKKKSEHLKEFVKYGIYFPVIYGGAFLVILLAQALTVLVIPDYTLFPVTAFCFKFLFSVLISFVIAELRFFIKLPKSNYFYSYLLTVAAFINIYIFSALDLPLLFLFSIEYLIIHFARPVKKTPYIAALTALILGVFYFPVIRNISVLSQSSLAAIVKSTPLVNFYESCLLVILQLLLVRFAISIKHWYSDNASLKKFIIKEAVWVSLLVITVLSGLIIDKAVLGNKREERLAATRMLSAERGVFNEDFELKTQKKVLNNRIDFSITAKSPYKVFKYEIVAKNVEGRTTVTDSIFPMILKDKSGTVYFMPDENPPNPFVFTGTASVSGRKPDEDQLEILIRAYYEKDGTVYTAARTVDFLKSDESL